ncbi:hypothetical protein Poli38472_006048 [Pythium oligandrum]|uniref:WRKY19-like zinc finger domain-containing protein n=1 Tax=Pythium oligandrum TaxID=41045 RepID=A0A8K1FLT0_PYTOL|nr:hypothetical protein Poli38472_006048 [Pythium oligandrum]|eukprot:TMW68580.1 hypothetical protein Poli38472_006048 [Pythium oligandrum]
MPSTSESDELTELSTGGPDEDSAAPSDIGVVNTPSRDAQPVRMRKVRRSRICRVDECTRYVVYNGLCISHGGGRQCAVDGCTSSAKSQGVCWKHGGSTKCSIEGCQNRAKSRGLCWSHGGGRKCKVDECIKTAVSNGLCWAHGGGKRCIIQNCKKPACERNRNLCVTHAGERLGEM